MKALEILNYIYRELSKNNTRGVWIEPKIIKEAIDELESIKQSDCPTSSVTSSKECCVSLEKRVTHIENTLEEIFKASAYNINGLSTNRKVWHYFRGNSNTR